MIGHGGAWSLGDLPVPSFMSYVFWWAIRNADEKDRKKFETRLWRPPHKSMPIPKNSPWSAENEMAAFASLRAETTGAVALAPKAPKPS